MTPGSKGKVMPVKSLQIFVLGLKVENNDSKLILKYFSFHIPGTGISKTSKWSPLGFVLEGLGCWKLLRRETCFPPEKKSP